MQLSFFEPMDKYRIDGQKDWYEQSLEIIPIALIGLINKMIMYCNQSAIALFLAFDKDKILSRKLADFVSPRYREKLNSYLYLISKSAESDERLVAKFKSLKKNP